MESSWLPTLRENWPIIAGVAASLYGMARWVLGTKWRLERDAALVAATLAKQQAGLAEWKANQERTIIEIKAAQAHCRDHCENNNKDIWVVVRGMHDNIAKTRESLVRIEERLGTERRCHPSLITETTEDEAETEEGKETS